MASVPDSPGTAAPIPAGLDSRSLARRAMALAVLVAVILAAIATLPGLDDVRARFADATPGWLVLAFALEAASVASFVVAFRGVFCRRMSWRFSAQIALSEQAANVLVPAGGAGGLALGAWALRRTGMDTERIARRTIAFWLITSSTNFFAVVGVAAAIAVGLLPFHGSWPLVVVPAALALATITIVLVLPRFLRRVHVPSSAGRTRRTVAQGARVVADGVRDAVALVARGGPAVVGGALGYLLFDIATLTAAFAAFGSTPAAGDLLLAYLIGQLGGLVPLPGGIGGTDGGLVAAFVLFGTPLAAATAAVLAYRVFQLGLPAVTGIAAFAALRRTLVRLDGPPVAGS